MLALRVHKKDGEETRKALVRLGIMSDEFLIGQDGDYLLFPITSKKSAFLENKEVVDADLKPRETEPRSLSKAMGLDNLRAFDVIGDIAVIEIPDELKPREKEIGETLLKIHHNLKTVVAKDSGVKGDYRVRNVRHLAGEEKTETVHKESGCRFLVDVSKVYFSPRLSHERSRISELVKDDEHVLALFSGVAPFPIVIARKNRTVRAYSIELNPEGHRYALENVKLNKVQKIVVPIEGDVKEILKDKRFWNWADRIIMPLPKDAVSFLPHVSHAARKGCIIHVYAFCPKGKEDELGEEVKKLVGRPCEIEYARRVRTYSPDTDQFVFDVKVLE